MLITSLKCLAADNNASYHRLVLQEQEANSKLNANRYSDAREYVSKLHSQVCQCG
jgi:hypothetical protein